ncbi:MAG: hypothetical protein IKW39_04630 [Alphaproteobacteria bacterium]|nr:hypothetical protein [Alphaproteobacteria bacterium]
MTKRKDDFLLERYFKHGFLDKKYYHNNTYYQPYTAKDRLTAGLLFYKDFISWKQGHLHSLDPSIPKVDYSYNFTVTNIPIKRFRSALRKVSTPFIPILYKIVLEQQEIPPPVKCTKRERLYFNDEIKTLLCRGLDELISYYQY